MSLVKRALEEQLAQGFAYTEDFVCVNCVEDEALKDAISSNLSSKVSCTFCGNPSAASLDVLIEAFLVGLYHEYGDADDELAPYQSSEGGYLIQTYDTGDLLEEFGEVLSGDGLFEAVGNLLNERVWVERDWMVLRRDIALRHAWNEFAETIKYKTLSLIHI